MGWRVRESHPCVFGSAQEECGGGAYSWALETLALEPLARAREEAPSLGGVHALAPLLFIDAVPNTKLCAWGEEDTGGHAL